MLMKTTVVPSPRSSLTRAWGIALASLGVFMASIAVTFLALPSSLLYVGAFVVACLAAMFFALAIIAVIVLHRKVR